MRKKITNFIDRLFARPKPNRNWDPIVIYQMGKVGSLTIRSSLEELFRSLSLKIPMYHAHNLNNLESLEATIRTKWPNPAEALPQMKLDAELRMKIDSDSNQKWNVISLTRDPVARNISTLFQMLNIFFPDWESKYDQGKLSLDELQDFFVNKFSGGAAPAIWFDQQMKPVFDIDVYAYDFRHWQGYEIYPCKNNGKLLLLRLEDLDRVAQQAMKEFLKIENFRLIKSNMGMEKQYATLYHDFKKIPLPTAYLEKMYGTKYTKHFYTNQEIEKFYERWAYPDKK